MNANWARDPYIALKQEFDAAMADGSCEALEIFIARHPENENDLTSKAIKAFEAKKCQQKKG